MFLMNSGIIPQSTYSMSQSLCRCKFGQGNLHVFKTLDLENPAIEACFVFCPSHVSSPVDPHSSVWLISLVQQYWAAEPLVHITYLKRREMLKWILIHHGSGCEVSIAKHCKPSVILLEQLNTG